MKALPLALTILRAALGPGIVAVAWWWPSRLLLGAIMVVGIVSDIFDGIIARKLGVATPDLRRLDSRADTIFYIGVLVASWHLYRVPLQQRFVPVAVVLVLEAARHIFDFAKFGKDASYHMWSAKLWGIALFVGFFSLLALGQAGWTLDNAVWLGIVANLEGLVISMILVERATDVPSIHHALCLRREQLSKADSR